MATISSVFGVEPLDFSDVMGALQTDPKERAQLILGLLKRPEFIAFVAEAMRMRESVEAQSGGKETLPIVRQMMGLLGVVVRRSRMLTEVRPEKAKQGIMQGLRAMFRGERGDKDYRFACGLTEEEYEGLVAEDDQAKKATRQQMERAIFGED